MAFILNIETATKNCSVSIAKDGDTICLRESNEEHYSHAERLHVFIEELVKEANITFNTLDAIAVSKGPGSYTGLRIGVSAAKGLCFALNIPLIAVDTLEGLARAIHVKEGELIVPMIDARRLEVYSAVYDYKGAQIENIVAKVIDDNAFKGLLDQQSIHFLGDGAKKCRPIIKHPHAVFHENYWPSAENMGELSYQKFIKKDFEDVAYFEPYYLKDFIAGKPKKLL